MPQPSETLVGTDLASIESVLAELWAPEDVGGDGDSPARLRVCLGNVVVLGRPGRAGEIAEIMDVLSRRRPVRVISIELTESPTETDIAASVVARCFPAAEGRPQICCETIHLHCGGGSHDRLRGIVTPLLEADLPSLLWCDLDPEEAGVDLALLARPMDSLLYDLDRVQSYQGLADLRTELPGVALQDLAWGWAEPWRRELARVFHDPDALALLRKIRRVSIAGAAPRPEAPPAAGLLYAGWLAGQLGWRPRGPFAPHGDGLSARLDGPEGEIEIALEGDRAEKTEPGGARSIAASTLTRIRLEAEGGANVELALAGPESIAISATLPNACPLPRRVAAAGRSAAESIGWAIENAGADDVVYARALERALALAGVRT